MKHTFHGVKLGGPGSVVAAPAPAPIANFAGMSFSANGNGWPPDTNGDVGPNHYIQVVNTSVGIFDKASGAELVAVSFNTFFQGSPDSACRTLNYGDPVALYDAMADRWLVTDFAFAASTATPASSTSASRSPRPATRSREAGTSTSCAPTPGR